MTDLKLNHRNLLYGLGASLGSVTFSNLLAQESQVGPLVPKHQMLSAKAKACIFICLEGGPGHMDTFDPKPKLSKFNQTESARDPNQLLVEVNQKTYYVGGPFKFQKADNAGIDICDQFIHMAMQQ